MESLADLERFLATTTLLSVLPVDVVRDVARVAVRKDVCRGSALFAAGSSGDEAYVVRSGVIQIVTPPASGGRLLGEAVRGDHVGEMAVLTGEPRAASAVAAVDAVLYAIPGATLRALFTAHPLLHARLSLVLMRSLQRRAEPTSAGARVIGINAAGRAVEGSLALAVAIADAVQTLDGSRVVILDCRPGSAASAAPPDAADADDLEDATVAVRRLAVPVAPSAPTSVPIKRLGRDCDANAPLAGLVAELRRRYDRVVLHATLPWSGPVPDGMAQCDALLWVSLAGDAAGEQVRAEAAQAFEARRRGVSESHVIHLASGAATEARPVGQSGVGSHVVPEVTDLRVAAPYASPAAARAVRGVARALAGARIALVLGAGGAKGFAHLGVLRAFERHGIEFDAVAGSSIGAIVGALVAMGWRAAELEALFMGIAANPWGVLLDPRVPSEALFRSKKKSELIASHCSGRRIEDLLLPLFAIAGDLNALVPVVFSRGPLAVALDATSAIPTVFRPVRHEGQLLVDGWVCNPLPVDVVRTAGYARVVAVDLSPSGPGTSATKRLTVPAGGIGGRFRILAIAMRAMELASREHVSRTAPLADVLVRPELDGYSSADLSAARAMFDRGEGAGEEAAAAVLRLGAARGAER